MGSKGTHAYRGDPRNDDIPIDINGEPFPRDKAAVSVFDSGFRLRRRPGGRLKSGISPIDRTAGRLPN